MNTARKALFGLFVLVVFCLIIGSATAQNTTAEQDTNTPIDDQKLEEAKNAGLIALAAGAAVTITGVATAWAEKEIGAATVGAMAENEKLFGKGITLMVLPETIVLFGFIIAFMLIGKMV